MDPLTIKDSPGRQNTTGVVQQPASGHHEGNTDKSRNTPAFVGILGILDLIFRVCLPQLSDTSPRCSKPFESSPTTHYDNSFFKLNLGSPNCSFTFRIANRFHCGSAIRVASSRFSQQTLTRYVHRHGTRKGLKHYRAQTEDSLVPRLDSNREARSVHAVACHPCALRALNPAKLFRDAQRCSTGSTTVGNKFYFGHMSKSLDR